MASSGEYHRYDEVVASGDILTVKKGARARGRERYRENKSVRTTKRPNWDNSDEIMTSFELWKVV